MFETPSEDMPFISLLISQVSMPSHDGNALLPATLQPKDSSITPSLVPPLPVALSPVALSPVAPSPVTLQPKDSEEEIAGCHPKHGRACNPRTNISNNIYYGIVHTIAILHKAGVTRNQHPIIYSANRRV